jgi:acetolactate synthase regulatory subunit
MTEPKKLVRVLTTEVPGGYELVIESDDGRVVRVVATSRQIEALARQFTKLVDDEEQAGG